MKEKKTWRVSATARVKPVVEHLQGKYLEAKRVNLQATRSGNRVIGT